MTSVFGGWVDGVVQWIEKELPAIKPAADADIAAARAHFQPAFDHATKSIEADAQHLASIVQADGLKVITAAAAAFQGGTVEDAVKAALIGLQAAGKDVTQLSGEALQHAVMAAQAAPAAPTAPGPVKP